METLIFGLVVGTIVSICFIIIVSVIYWIILSIKYKIRWKTLEQKIKKDFWDANPISDGERKFFKDLNNKLIKEELK